MMNKSEMLSWKYNKGEQPANGTDNGVQGHPEGIFEK